MLSINEIVSKILKSDIAIQRNLEKEIINIRALARFIIKNYNLKENIDAVISAIRRFKSKESFSKAEEALKPIFKNATITTKCGVCCATIKASNLNQVLDFLKNKKAKIIASNKIKFFFENIDKENVIKSLSSFIEELKENLCEICIYVHPSAIVTKGVLARLTNEIALANINILEIIVSTPEIIFYVDEKDAIEAHKSLLALCR